MRAPGGISITEERELHAMRDWLNRYPTVVETLHSVDYAVALMRAHLAAHTTQGS